MTQIKRLLTVVSAIFVIHSVSAQQSVGGFPVSQLFPAIAEKNVPEVKMPAVDEDALRREDAENALSLEKRARFGLEIPVSINPDNAGIVDQLPNGDKIWRVSVSSPGANSLNFIFSQYQLPPGAQLFIYSPDRSEMIGAFTEANNQWNYQLGTTLVMSDRVIVEYYEPARARFAGRVEIGTVVHGYRLPGETVNGINNAEDRGFGASGSCNINVACPLGDGWGPQKRSVVKIVNGGDWCTGAFINNTNNNGTPYLLTANHCYTNNYPNWVYWFNFQSSTCSNPGSSPSYSTMTGATLKARRSASDFCLLQLTSAPPSALDVFYSGWSRSTSAPTQETGIHHPSGDIKKICRDNNAATSGGAGGWGTNHWRVYWDQGVTEGGSSGSPLYDQNQRIVGQLHGGASACGNSAANMWDEYGKLSDSWNGTKASNRLRDWLDPSNTVTTLDGYSPTGNYSKVAGNNGNVGADEDVYVFDIVANTSWTAESLNPWIRILETDRANGKLTVAFDANASIDTRTGMVQIKAEKGEGDVITLRQFGSGSSNRSSGAFATVFPNPTNGRTVVEIGEKGTATIQVFDVNGKLVVETFGEGRADIDLSAQPKGLYMVRVTLNETQHTLKLWKN